MSTILENLIQSENDARVFGFNWPNQEMVIEWIISEANEVSSAIKDREPTARVQEEIGDLLLVAVNLARHLNVNAEVALKQSTKKFAKRFNYIEQQVEASGRSLKDCELDELDAFWHEAKVVLKTTPLN